MNFRMQPIRQSLQRGIHKLKSEHGAGGEYAQGDPDDRRPEHSQYGRRRQSDQ